MSCDQGWRALVFSFELFYKHYKRKLFLYKAKKNFIGIRAKANQSNLLIWLSNFGEKVTRRIRVLGDVTPSTQKGIYSFLDPMSYAIIFKLYSLGYKDESIIVNP